MYRHVPLTVLIYLIHFCGQSQHLWRISKLGVADGLSQGYVYAIHQDKKGFIWIGTHGGLNRYDGYRFKTFQHSPYNASTLSDNAVFFLKEDTVTGKFWVGGSSSLNEFDPETFTNARHRYNRKQLEFADGVFISRDEILLACEHAVLLFHKKKRQFIEIPVYDENNNLIEISRVENLASDRRGNFMIMSRTGIFFYDSLSKKCRRKISTSPDFSSFNNHEVFNVLHDRNDYYWIATNRNGLIRFDPRTNTHVTISLPSPIQNETIRFDAVIQDSHGNIWAGSTKGLFKIHPASLKVEHFSADTPGKDALSHNEINSIYEDRNHFMWIGTVGDGVNRMIPKNGGFRDFPVIKNSKTSTGSYIMALEQLGNEIWFTNIWDQVGRIDLKTGESKLATGNLFHGGYRWYSEGAIIKNKESELSLLNGEYHYRIIRNNTGDITIQSQSSPGLCYLYTNSSGTMLKFIKKSVEATFARNDTIYGNQFFYDVKEDDFGNIWIGSSKGLIKYNRDQNTFIHFRHDDKNKNSISSDFIYRLQIDDEEKTIWMAAYTGGLCKYNFLSGVFQHYNKDDGLSDNTVYSIEKDNHGNLWLSSNAGISQYNIKTGTFQNYGVADGLLNNEFNRRSSFKNDDGWLFFGGVSGVDYFHPDSIVNAHINSTLTFTNFRVVNTDYISGSKSDVPTIELQPDNRHITIEFASLDYIDQHKTQYAYRFDDNEWISLGPQNALSFSNLSIGTHQLFVRSTNTEGTWLNNEISCRIVVQPWWWQTGWFRNTIAFLAIVIIGGGIHIYYHRKLERQKTILERQQAVERERTRIATDMHDDLGANLSRIKFLSETIAIKGQLQQPITDEVTGIREYSREMIDKMGEIVWALNEKNDSLSDLIAYTRAYAADYLVQNGVQANIQTPETIPNLFVNGEFRRNVYLTVKEALHNVVKHSQASKVDIRVKTEGRLCITIADNGKGFDKNYTRPFSNGIANMRKRMQALGGTLEIRNTSGGTVILTIPLL